MKFLRILIRYFASLVETFFINRRLILNLTTRDINSRYKGSILGIVWSFLNPLMMLCIYTFVFSVIFKARWPGGSESRTEFALVLFSGLIIFNLFAECINSSPHLISGNINYVKKIKFPLEILPFVSLGASLFHFVVSFIIWLVFYLLIFGIPSIKILFLTLILIPLLFTILGLSWFISSLSVYFKDFNQLVTIFTTVLMFLSPIFYPIEAVPEKFRLIMLLNPVAGTIEQARQILIWNGNFEVFSWLISFTFSFLFSILGFIWFKKIKRGFADVI